MDMRVITEGKNVYIYTSGVRMRVDRMEFVPAVISYLNGGNTEGMRYILGTETYSTITEEGE